MNLRILFKNSYKELKLGGVRSFIKKTSFYLKYKLFVKSFSFEEEFARWKKYDPDQISLRTEKIEDIKKAKIVFLVPGTHISGGVAMVFQHANRLQKKGYNIEIFSLSNMNSSEWFPGQNVLIVPYMEASKKMADGSVDVLIASNWSTAFTVWMANAKRKMYYVQSDESRFFPEDKEICEKIKLTYELPMTYFTEALWIQKWLKDEFGHEVHYVPNGIDPEIFKKTDPIESKSGRLRVLIEGSINVPFKGMQDAYDAVKDLDCDLWIVSNDGRPKKDWKFDRFFENVPFDKMNEIYSSCDIFLKMSRIEGFFGPPMEAMACGCAVVVGKVTGYDEYIVNEKNALVVEMGDVDGAKKAIHGLINNNELREVLISGGYKTVKEWTWSKSSSMLEEIIRQN